MSNERQDVIEGTPVRGSNMGWQEIEIPQLYLELGAPGWFMVSL